MVSVASLLNPVTPETEPPNPFPTPCSMLYSPEVSPRMPLGRKQKLCKDEATFVKGKPQEEVRYWPCEHQGGLVTAEHEKYRLYPIGHITEYCKHVPYRSEKKTFLNKTGREGFHVFQYTFQMPREEKKHTVMWDYNNGLVRITPFFKALEYPKTAPARMLCKNPGLKDMCHSITGGSLAAQGYWMPFEAAKAVATTFCYRIRYVLTPIFGLDFPGQCIPPGAPGYDSMHISPQLVRNCVLPVSSCGSVNRDSIPRSRPETPSSTGTTAWTPANARSKTPRAADSGSGYGTETDWSDTYLCSPRKPAKSGFKSLMTGQSASMRKRYKTCYAPSTTPSSTCGDDSDYSEDCKKRKRHVPKPIDDDSDDSVAEVPRSSAALVNKKRKASSATPMMTAEVAAQRLLDLFLEDAQLTETKKRRASL